MSALGPIFYLTASFLRGNLSSWSIHGGTCGCGRKRRKRVADTCNGCGHVCCFSCSWMSSWLLGKKEQELCASSTLWTGTVQMLLLCLSTSPHCQVHPRPNWKSLGWFPLSFLECQQVGSVSKAGLNPKSRRLCPRQTAEGLLWFKRFIMAVRSAAAVASKPPGISTGAEITFCVSQFSLARNFFMQSLPCLTLRVVHSGTS